MSAGTSRESDYRHALAQLEQAQTAVLLWGDSVSADTERRLGVSSSDERRYADPEYAATLNVVQRVQEALRMIRALGPAVVQHSAPGPAADAA